MTSAGQPRRLTIYDVARESGFAASTVSRAYSRPGRVHAETARHIFATAERIGYRSERLKAPEQRQTESVGLVIADVTNPFYGEIIKGASEAAAEAGYRIVLSHTSESAAVERQTIERAIAQVDGVVIAASRMTDSAIRMIAKQTTVVLLNRIIPEVSCITSDAARGVQRAVDHLMELGHESVLYVAGPATSWSDGVRWRALRETGRTRSVAVSRLGPHEPTVLAGFKATERIVQTGATAVLAFNDQLAIGVMKGLRALGLVVPRDVSIMGFDNIIFDEIIEPGLTTIAAPLYKMGFTGVRNCIALAGGAKHTGEPLIMPVQLVRRASTGPCPQPRTSPEPAVINRTMKT